MGMGVLLQNQLGKVETEIRRVRTELRDVRTELGTRIDRAAAELGTRIDKGNETGQSDLFPDESEVIPFLTVVEAVLDQLAIAVEQLAVHVAGLVERVAPRLVQEAHQREVAPRKRTRSAEAVRTLWNRIR